jgi:putative lipoic acid-binding regulatory protein
MTEENTTETLFEFPCQFPIKALGKTSATLDIVIIEIVRRHAGDVHETAIKSKPSKGGKYTAVTITIEATSKQQLDAIYQDLTDCSEVIMAL